MCTGWPRKGSLVHWHPLVGSQCITVTIYFVDVICEYFDFLCVEFWPVCIWIQCLNQWLVMVNVKVFTAEHSRPLLFTKILIILEETLWYGTTYWQSVERKQGPWGNVWGDQVSWVFMVDLELWYLKLINSITTFMKTISFQNVQQKITWNTKNTHFNIL